ncbi:hypothetical protein AUJ17_01365 [Candidatus Micrarchaeota archaeon CG1_02_47_40]|nr:MAG: hypothetical protein AUJ17_01365 [Candidatus Micrarchaeota archaeon CG1_02_47_40]
MKRTILQIVFSLIVLAAVVSFADVGKVAEVIAGANLAYFAVALVFYFAINAVMAYRIQMILEYLGTKLEYKKILTSHFSGMLASDFTPARSGYFATAAVLAKNHKVKSGEALVSILGPQMFDFIYKLVAGGIGAWYLFSFVIVGAGENAGAGIVLGLLGLFGMVAFMALLLFSQRFLGMISFAERLPFGGKALEMIGKMQENSHAISALTPHILVLIFITWIFKAIEWWFIAMSLGVKPEIAFAPIIFWGFVQPIITLLQFMPLPTIAGAGVSEAGAAFVLMQFGIGLPQAIAFTLMTRFVMILVDSVGIVEGIGWIGGNKRKSQS